MIRASLIRFFSLVLILGIGGCASGEKPPAIPANQVTGLPATAKLIKEGKGKISIEIQKSGILFLYDLNEGRVIWSGLAEAKERLIVDPEINAVMVNTLQVYDAPLDPLHWRRVYLDPG